MVVWRLGGVARWRASCSHLDVSSRVRVALPQSAAARRGDSRSEEGEKAVPVSYIRRRLEVLGPGTAAAAGRRRWAQVQEQRWRKDKQAMLLSERQGRSIESK
jgi:hypothetical protein